ncbi:MAG: hypothetical protein K2K49_01650 [Duncaniella sp.]|nr:hypothetical protein [Duncaniella sp.]
MNTSTTSKKSKSSFIDPALRVSHKIFTRILNAAINDAAQMPPKEAIKLIRAVQNYMKANTQCPYPDEEFYKVFEKYRDPIDRAAVRSHRARKAAMRRRARREEAARLAAEAEANKRQSPDAPTGDGRGIDGDAAEYQFSSSVAANSMRYALMNGSRSPSMTPPTSAV